jgi:4-hydroxybenzoate polyprenyltransferase
MIQLMRPHQWIKNAFVLAPLLFSGAFLDESSVWFTFIAFMLFCLASSVTYIFNDLHDVEEDKQHPIKSKTRPLASGGINKNQAYVLLVFLLLLLLSIGLVYLPKVLVIITAYLVLMVLYTITLKHQPILDIFSISIGFVLRVYAGAVAISVPVSGWMFITTLSLALYLASIKRRQELKFSSVNSRKVLKYYTESLVQRYAEMSATGALVFYSLFVVSERPEMIMTIPIVLFGLFRYWYLVEAEDKGESTTDILIADWQLIVTLIIWVGLILFVLWPAS